VVPEGWEVWAPVLVVIGLCLIRLSDCMDDRDAPVMTDSSDCDDPDIFCGELGDRLIEGDEYEAAMREAERRTIEVCRHRGWHCWMQDSLVLRSGERFAGRALLKEMALIVGFVLHGMEGGDVPLDDLVAVACEEMLNFTNSHRGDAPISRAEAAAAERRLE
jgi:hypothetical protein